MTIYVLSRVPDDPERPTLTELEEAVPIGETIPWHIVPTFQIFRYGRPWQDHVNNRRLIGQRQ